MKFESKTKWFLLAFFVISVTMFVSVMCRNKKRTDSVRLLRDSCSREDPADTIFVVLPCSTYDSDACLKTLDTLLHKSACPFRIRVGLWEESGHDKKQNTMVRYSIRAKQTHAKDFSEVVKFFSCPSRTFFGAASARRNSLQKLYNGERFILLVEPGVYMIQNWDRKLVRWNKLIGEHTVLTGAPSRSHGEHNSVYSARFYTARAFHTRSELSLTTKTFSETPKNTDIDCLFITPRLTFAFGNLLLGAYKSKDIDGCRVGEAAYLSAHLWKPTRRFVHFPDTIAWGSPNMIASSNIRSGSDKHLRALDLLDRTFSSNPEFSEFCGINFLNQQLSARGVMGVTPELSENNIMHKYGSWTNFSEIANVFMSD